MEDGYLKQYSYGIPEGLAILGILLIATVILWFVRNWQTPFNDHKLLSEGNTAVAIDRAGFVLAQVIAMTYAIGGYDPDYVLESLVLIAGKNLFILIALVIFANVVDWAVLPKIKNHTLLVQGNHAVAIANAGCYIGIGFILGASTVGTASTLGQTILGTAAFAALGLAVVIAVVRLHVLLNRKSFNFDEQIEQDNIVPAIDLAALVVAVSLVISVGVAGDMTSWWDALKAFGATCVFALGMLYIPQPIVNRIATKGESVGSIRTKHNTAVISMIATGRIGLALVVWAVLGNVL